MPRATVYYDLRAAEIPAGRDPFGAFNIHTVVEYQPKDFEDAFRQAFDPPTSDLQKRNFRLEYYPDDDQPPTCFYVGAAFTPPGNFREYAARCHALGHLPTPTTWEALSFRGG